MIYQNPQEQILDLVDRLGSINKAATELGIARSTAQARYKAALAEQDDPTPPGGNQARSDFEWPDLPDGETPIDELIGRKVSDFRRGREFRTAHKLIDVNVKKDGPIGLGVFGDPHTDDDGCDIEQLLADADMVRETDGLYGINVGDSNNLWPGRLAIKYADQITRAEDGWRLTEHFVERTRDWVAMMKGNHDHFVGLGDPLDWIRRPSQYLQADYNIRLRLNFPNGRQFKIWLRHDFAGHSMWNGLHGMVKAAKMGAGMNLLLAGHRHDVGHHSEYDPYQGIYFHALRTAGYKEFDDYAEKLQHEEMTNIYKCPVIIIDPYANNEADFAEVIRNTEKGADFLTFLRKKRRV